MIERTEYQGSVEAELGRFEQELERFRTHLAAQEEPSADDRDKLAAMERIHERGTQVLDQLEAADEYEEWDAVRCQMDGVLSEMRNAVMNIGLSHSE